MATKEKTMKGAGAFAARAVQGWCEGRKNASANEGTHKVPGCRKHRESPRPVLYIMESLVCLEGEELPRLFTVLELEALVETLEIETL